MTCALSFRILTRQSLVRRAALLCILTAGAGAVSTACVGDDEKVGSGGQSGATAGGGSSMPAGAGGSAPSAMGGAPDAMGGLSGAAGNGGEMGSSKPPGRDWQRIPKSALDVLLDPYGETPLAAIVRIDASALQLGEVSLIEVEIGDPEALDDPLRAELDPRSEEFRQSFDFSDLLAPGEIAIPVLGLFQNADNLVHLSLTDGETFWNADVTVTTPEVLSNEVVVRTSVPEKMEPGLTYVSAYRQRSFLFDRFGRVRWRGRSFLHLTKEGHLLTGLATINWFGKIQKSWRLSHGFVVHHDAVVKPDGHLLACVTYKGTTITPTGSEPIPAFGDHVVEVDEEGGIINLWDLREFLDIDRETVAAGGEDWAHVNTIAYDPEDDTLLVSAHHQGILKLKGTRTSEGDPASGKSLVWLLAPHLDWGLAGLDGAGPLNPSDSLLTALDSQGTPLSELAQDNLEADPSFHWPIGHHGLAITHPEPGKLRVLTFSNQASFIFDGPGSIDNGSDFDFIGNLDNDRANPPYSLLVEYEIDEQAMTVRQTWSYGTDQPELYGSYNGGVNLLPKTGNRMMISNGSSQHTEELGLNPHVVELSSSGQVVFHLEIPTSDGVFSAYRGGRVDPYHPSLQ